MSRSGKSAWAEWPRPCRRPFSEGFPELRLWDLRSGTCRSLSGRSSGQGVVPALSRKGERLRRAGKEEGKGTKPAGAMKE
jgi:hypothetical protein